MKICENCNTKTEDGAAFCPHCGSDKLNSVTTSPQAETESGKTNNSALAGLILGIVSCIFGLLLIPNILAIVYSRRGMKSSGENGGKGLATAGFVLGIITTSYWGLMWAIVLLYVIAAI